LPETVLPPANPSFQLILQCEIKSAKCWHVVMVDAETHVP
jgi:hypothetical protein